MQTIISPKHIHIIFFRHLPPPFQNSVPLASTFSILVACTYSSSLLVFITLLAIYSLSLLLFVTHSWHVRAFEIDDAQDFEHPLDFPESSKMCSISTILYPWDHQTRIQWESHYRLDIQRREENYPQGQFWINPVREHLNPWENFLPQQDRILETSDGECTFDL